MFCYFTDISNRLLFIILTMKKVRLIENSVITNTVSSDAGKLDASKCPKSDESQ
jgi:hypothetical protein